MADISQVTIPNGTTYNLKDARLDPVLEEIYTGKIWYGVCNTAAATQAKTVTIEGLTEYKEGMNVRIRFSGGQSYSGVPTLNINNIGAVAIKQHWDENSSRYEWGAGEIVDFCYSNARWLIVRGTHASTEIYGVVRLTDSLTNTSLTLAPTASALAETYSLASGKQNALIYSASTPTNAVAGDVWLKPPSMTIEEARCLIVTSGAISSLPTTISDSSITSDMVVINQTFTNPSAQTGDWTWTTADGSLTLSGTISGTTYATFYLIKSR